MDTMAMTTSATKAPPTSVVKRAGLAGALVALLAIVWMPPAQGLPEAGQVMLGILAFAVSSPAPSPGPNGSSPGRRSRPCSAWRCTSS